MHTMRKYWMYGVPLVFVGIIGLLALQFPEHDNALTWFTAASAFVLAAYGLIVSLSEHRRRLSADRPDLAATVKQIRFHPFQPQKNASTGPQVPLHSIEFSLDVRNRGNVATTVVACFLSLEGEPMETPRDLDLHPPKLLIAPRSQEELRVILEDFDIEQFRNRNGVLNLRDAADHQFPIRVVRIAPGVRLERITDLLVRRD